MVERLPQHRHCIECGNAIASKEKYCSDECNKTHTAKVQSRKKQLLLLYFGSFIVLVILVILSFWRF